MSDTAGERWITRAIITAGRPSGKASSQEYMLGVEPSFLRGESVGWEEVGLWGGVGGGWRATLPGAWRYRVSARISVPGVSVQ